MAIFTAKEFIERLKDVALTYKTLYVNGCFGAPMIEKNKKRYTSGNNEYNNKHSNEINAASEDTFGFDCVCLIKAILWGWNGDIGHIYGGSTYKSNGVDDMALDTMLSKCSDVSTDFSTIAPGELLWMKGHVGIYIGDRLAVECTSKWDSKVQITTVKNVGAVDGYNARTWTKHGKLPWIDYDTCLSNGSTGDDVELLQKYLTIFGFNCGEADGLFDEVTQKAVKAYQKSRGYEETGVITFEQFDAMEQEYINMVFGVKEEKQEIADEEKQEVADKDNIVVKILQYIIQALQNIVDALKK